MKEHYLVFLVMRLRNGSNVQTSQTNIRCDPQAAQHAQTQTRRAYGANHEGL